jgi:enediyne biosynthesis protein E4
MRWPRLHRLALKLRHRGDEARGDRPDRPRNIVTRALAILAFLLAVHVALALNRVVVEQSAATVANDASADVIAEERSLDLRATRANISVMQPPSPFRFTEIAKESGVDFVHFSGMTKDKHFPTAYGSGLAIFDYDGDGRMDLYFANGTLFPVGTASTGTNRLYRNLGAGRFKEATKAAGLAFAGYCHGIVTGDIDNDGDSDVFLFNCGRNVLYLNRGNGTFQDISRQAGIDREGWSPGGALLDYDTDGDLDLYVLNYGKWKLPEDDLVCERATTVDRATANRVRVYCSPHAIQPARHILFRNNGDLTFTDVTDAAGVARSDGRGLGAVAADLNDDGRIDLYIANDMCPNFVYLNRGDGTFVDATESSGAGYGPNGAMRAGMGVDAEDVDGDGRADLLVTNFLAEGNALFINLGEGQFEDRARTSGIFHDSLAWVGWGCVLGDFDGDGWPDCFVANGHVDDNLHLISRMFNSYAEPALLHRNEGGKRFALATRDAGAYFDSDHVGRGVAYGDLDNDGDIDLAINHKDAPAAVLRNDTNTPNQWIRLCLVGVESNRDAIGARVEVEAGGRTIFRQRKGGGSLGASHDPRLLIGIGGARAVDRLTVRWPSGRVDRHADLEARTSWLIPEGSAHPERMPRIN